LANLDLVTVCPAVPDLIPSWFHVTPVGGSNTGLCQWGGWCRRGWDSGGTHSCNGELDVGDGCGEYCVGGYWVLDGGGILLNFHVCQIIKGRSHLLCLFKFGGLVCTKHCVPCHHLIDVAHFGKDDSPMGLPVGPCVVRKQATFSLVPSQHHVATHQGALGACGNHGVVGDGDSGIGCKDLAFLMFPIIDSKGEARVNARMEVGMSSSRSG
jgi:hypothetical protein